ncbi:hypothetical protein [Tanticharoenia sakaeratensis]|uniref:hypothetical protein n=1 Tax=Tanticharoenia sakaeratensis TaxID=444053 RepID=UPI0006620FAB|nr:hypothetical protein [Tanticharoenia sakaeratensis]
MSETAPSAFATVPRALIAAVIGMGVAIVLGVAALAGILIHRMSSPPAAISAATTTAVSGPAASSGMPLETTLPVPSGARIASVTARQDGTLAILIEAVGREQLVIWNPDARRIVATLMLQPAP